MHMPTNTHLLYLDGFDITACDARVVQIQHADDDRLDIQLDCTCFYPRGGGQDWDEGTIITANGVIFDVREVRLDENGVVHHVGTLRVGMLKVHDEVQCVVAPERRAVNTRLHSAGHVIDLAVDRMGLPWVALKGAHYPHMSFVEYDGVLEPDATESTRQGLETIANDVIAKGSHNEIRFMPLSDMHTVCRHIPENIPTNKPARVVIYNDTFGVPCGGTHVANVHDIGAIAITKIKTKKGVTKVSYSVDGIK
jgi:Ser-tRNA(Ala) deacylase AlaX